MFTDTETALPELLPSLLLEDVSAIQLKRPEQSQEEKSRRLDSKNHLLGERLKIYGFLHWPPRAEYPHE